MPNSSCSNFEEPAHDSDALSDNEYDYEHSDDEGDEVLKEPTYLYNQDPITCQICCEDDAIGLALPKCRHSLCTECFIKHLETAVGQGYADNIKCPFCNETVTMDIIKEVVDDKSFQRLEKLKDDAFVMKNPDYHHCPTPDCGNIVLCRIIETTVQVDERANNSPPPPRICDCFKCEKTACLSCGSSPYHLGISCDEHELQLQRQQAANVIRNAYLQYTSRRRAELLQQMQAANVIRNFYLQHRSRSRDDDDSSMLARFLGYFRLPWRESREGSWRAWLMRGNQGMQRQELDSGNFHNIAMGDGVYRDGWHIHQFLPEGWINFNASNVIHEQERNYDFNLDAAESSALGIPLRPVTSSINTTRTTQNMLDTNSICVIKRCQRCGNGIERSSGCLHMTCRCGYSFCFKCGASLALSCLCSE